MFRCLYTMRHYPVNCACVMVPFELLGIATNIHIIYIYSRLLRTTVPVCSLVPRLSLHANKIEVTINRKLGSKIKKYNCTIYFLGL